MKVLSLLQPWASLVVIGEKLNETRSWQTAYRGELLIHASKAFKKYERDLCETEPFKSALRRHGLSADSLPLGAIIGKVNLNDCKQIEPETVPMFDLKDYQMKAPSMGWEYFFGDYTPGRYAWLLSDAKLLKEPILTKGALNIWEYPVKLQDADFY